MIIDRIAITYGELRSTGYPTFSNTRHEMKLEATLEPGDRPREVMSRLQALAKNEVHRLFGDEPSQNELDSQIPF